MGRDVVGPHGNRDTVIRLAFRKTLVSITAYDLDVAVPGLGQVPGGLIDDVLVDVHGDDAAFFADDVGQDSRVIAGARAYFQHP